MSPDKTMKPVEKKKKQSEEKRIQENLDQLLNNGVSRETPFYETINVFKYC